MSNYTVVDSRNNNTRVFDSRAEAEDKAKGLKGLVNNPSDIEVVQGSYESYEDFEADVAPETQEVNPEVVDMTEPEPMPTDPGTPAAKAAAPEPPQPTEKETAEAIDKLGESLEDDPLNILPGHMQDNIQGTPAINKRGYAMIAERYGIEVTTTIESYPWDNEESRCVAKAVAITEDGQRYTGHATACKGDGDMPEQIVELADTRAMKRAVSWASGLGIVAYEELSDEL